MTPVYITLATIAGMVITSVVLATIGALVFWILRSRKLDALRKKVTEGSIWTGICGQRYKVVSVNRVTGIVTFVDASARGWLPAHEQDTVHIKDFIVLYDPEPQPDA